MKQKVKSPSRDPEPFPPLTRHTSGAWVHMGIFIVLTRILESQYGTGHVQDAGNVDNIRDPDHRAARHPPEAFGSVSGARPLPVGLIAFTSYRRGRSWRPVGLTPGRGLLALVAHTVPVRHRTEASLTALRQAVTEIPILKGPRGEAGETAAALLRRLERETGPAAVASSRQRPQNRRTR